MKNLDIQRMEDSLYSLKRYSSDLEREIERLSDLLKGDGEKRVSLTRKEFMTAFENKRRKLKRKDMPTVLEFADEIFGPEKR